MKFLNSLFCIRFVECCSPSHISICRCHLHCCCCCCCCCRRCRRRHHHHHHHLSIATLAYSATRVILWVNYKFYPSNPGRASEPLSLLLFYSALLLAIILIQCDKRRSELTDKEWTSGIKRDGEIERKRASETETERRKEWDRIENWRVHTKFCKMPLNF